jgi:hypothetical protein
VGHPPDGREYLPSRPAGNVDAVISRVAVVPQPPLLVPELTGGAAGETAPLRDACLAAVRALAAAAENWTAVGAGEAAEFAPGARGSFAGYGVDVPVGLSETSREDPRELPLPVLVAGWLRERAGAASVDVRLLDPDLPAADCADLGRRLDEVGDEVGLLVLGDGSNRHGPQSPGGQDERAAGFDDAVSAALGSADLDALASLDPALAAELGSGGRVPWQVLAGVGGADAWRSKLLYSGAPLGVGYHVAVWERA